MGIKRISAREIFNMVLFREKAKSPRDAVPELKKITEGRWGHCRGYVFIYVLHDLNNLSSRFDLNLTQV